MKSKMVQRLLKLLIALSGAGVGMALSLTLVRLYGWAHPGEAVPVEQIVVLYLGTAVLGALICFVFSGAIIAKCGEWATALENRLDRLTMAQLGASVLGLVCGLLIAALVSQVIGFLGASMFTTAFSALLYVFLGAIGLSIGLRRSDEMGQLLGHIPSFRERRANRKNPPPQGRPKLLDTSAAIDGRVLDVCRTGFMEGELIVPDFVLDELRHIADSADNNRRARGRRGMDVLQKLREEPSVTVRVEHSEGDDAEVDVRLLRMAQQLGAAIITGDYNLNKAASIAGVGVLNVNDLAKALRPVVLPGEEMSVAILREGREPGQGVGYLEDGTMIVVEGGQGRQGQTVAAVVTSALQTSAGRMIFARLKT